MENSEQLPSDPNTQLNGEIDPRLRLWARWSAIISAAVGGVALNIFLITLPFYNRALVDELVQEHVRAIVGIPLAALTAFCVVTILEATSGELKFRGLGFEFEGASGPIVLWVLTFLSVITGIVVLW